MVSWHGNRAPNMSFPVWLSRLSPPVCFLYARVACARYHRVLSLVQCAYEGQPNNAVLFLCLHIFFAPRYDASYERVVEV